MKISAVLIVKNEEALLGRCLQSIKNADEIIVCDTGSTDRTIEIAKEHGAKVFTDFTWCDDFAKARNHAKSKATGSYILSIDADEVLHDFEKVRDAVRSRKLSYYVTMIAEHAPEEEPQTFQFPRLFKNCPEVWWEGAVHNHLNINGEESTGIEITYGYSPAHQMDPDRAMRILEREAKDDKTKLREMYYLGREYFYKKRYEECTATLGYYVQHSRFLPEKADAFLIMSQAYWIQHMGDDARDACLQALNINANFKEACLWMANISWEWNGRQWKKMAETATNENVLFVRVK